MVPVYRVPGGAMSLPDTTDLARYYCPTCEPGADPTRDILIVRWCRSHAPSDEGIDDAGVQVGPLSMTAEADGAACRAVQDLIR